MILFLYFGLACSGVLAVTQAPPKKIDTSLEPLKKVSLALQATESIFKEIMRILRQENKSEFSLPFAKMNHAMNKEFSLKKAKQSSGFLGCQKNKIIRNVQNKTGYPQSLTFIEACTAKADPYANLKIHSAQNISIELFPENLSGILGVQSSIFGKKISCELKLKLSGLISKLDCSNWTMDLGKGEYLDLKEIHYDESAALIVKVKGHVMSHVDKIKTIEMTIPLEGKITVKEVQVKDPKKDLPPEASQNQPQKQPLVPQDKRKLNPDGIVTEKTAGDQNKIAPPPEPLLEKEGAQVDESGESGGEPVEQIIDPEHAQENEQINEQESEQQQIQDPAYQQSGIREPEKHQEESSGETKKLPGR